MHSLHKYGLTGFLGSLLLMGCFNAFANTTASADPYEDFNRHMYAFNRDIDKVIVRPIAVVYQTLLPETVRTGVTHIFNNINTLPTIFNDVLQGQGRHALNDSGRFLINTTVGIAGIFDPAKSMGLPEHEEDFGLTLVKWGYKNSNFLVLPIFGPSTIRDAAGIPIDYAASIYPYIDDTTAYSLSGIELVNTRANALNYDNFVLQAFDPYIALKNVYLQHRESEIKKNEL